MSRRSQIVDPQLEQEFPREPRGRDVEIYFAVRVRRRTQQEVAEMYGLTQARISQIVTAVARWRADATPQAAREPTVSQRKRLDHWESRARDEQYLTWATEDYLQSRQPLTTSKTVKVDNAVQREETTVRQQRTDGAMLRTMIKLNRELHDYEDREPPPVELELDQAVAEAKRRAADQRERALARQLVKSWEWPAEATDQIVADKAAEGTLAVPLGEPVGPRTGANWQPPHKPPYYPFNSQAEYDVALWVNMIAQGIITPAEAESWADVAEVQRGGVYARPWRKPGPAYQSEGAESGPPDRGEAPRSQAPLGNASAGSSASGAPPGEPAKQSVADGAAKCRLSLRERTFFRGAKDDQAADGTRSVPTTQPRRLTPAEDFLRLNKHLPAGLRREYERQAAVERRLQDRAHRAWAAEQARRGRARAGG